MRPAERAGLSVVVVPFLVALALGGPDRRGAEEVFEFADPAIVESSGLVLTEGLVVTTNDSGDTGRVFVVDPGTGETVGLTTWTEDPVDVEALAPAAPGWVWVGDIGDNGQDRESVSVARVPVDRSERTAAVTSYELRHPGGPRDAEALLVHPVTGRLYVVTKSVLGGTLLAAPAELSADAPNRLRPLGAVLGMVTDGAFLPDGRHLVLRTYTRAGVYTVPGLDLVGTFPLPRQPQGEGLAVAVDGTLWLSTEGAGTPVLRVAVPREIRRAMHAPAAPTTSTASSSPSAPDPVPPEPGPGEAKDGWLGSTAWLVAALVVGVVAALAGRRRRPR